MGYLRLCDLLTGVPRTYRGRAEIRKSWFAETGTDGLIALSGAHLGDVGQALIVDNTAHAQALARERHALFPGRYYIELQRPGPGAMTSGAAAVPVEIHVQRAVQPRSRAWPPPIANPDQVREPDDSARTKRGLYRAGYCFGPTPSQYLPRDQIHDAGRVVEHFRQPGRSKRGEIAKRSRSSSRRKSQLPVFRRPRGSRSMILRRCAPTGSPQA